jgi:hypothetical protein
MRKGEKEGHPMRKFLYSHIPASLLLVFLATILWTCNGGGGGGGGTPDNTAPTVSSTSPADMADNVSIVTTVSATFSEEMDASTVNDTNFTVADGGGPVAGTVSYSGTTATFTPTDPLELSTTYTATVRTGVTDKAGNALGQDYTWSFTTAATFTGFTPDMVTGKAFASINEEPDVHYDNWVIQFDTGANSGNFDYWEAEYTYSTETFVPTVGQGTWSVSNGELIVDLPGEFHATVTLQDETNEYIDVQIDDESNPPENARMFKTNPFVEADVSGHTFDYGGGLTEVFDPELTGTQYFNLEVNSVFDWMVENGVLKETFEEAVDFTDFGYRLVNDDPNIVFVEFITSTGEFWDIYPETYTDTGP